MPVKRAFMKFLSALRLLLVAIWLGAAVFFIAVAQSAFAVLPEREMAGAVVNRTLTVLNFGGIGIAAILLATSVLAAARINRFWLWTERLLLVIIGAGCAVSQFVFGFWFAAIRAQAGQPIEQLAEDHALRLQFNSLHQYSEWVLMSAMVAALITFFIVANRKFDKAAAGKADVYDFSKEFKV
jgi:Domain of unknown function (DUF4149)